MAATLCNKNGWDSTLLPPQPNSGGSILKAYSENNNQPVKPKLLDQVRQVLRAKHYSLQIEQTRVQWARPLTLYHCKRNQTEIAENGIDRIRLAKSCMLVLEWHLAEQYGQPAGAGIGKRNYGNFHTKKPGALD